ncbi:MAG: InlB B-repeat-containing protein, partial [Thermodesulfobacteriota bacterium]|nr:InlB B-repeat-containing protein [Thermodesulfobacteriota bacterium]
VWVDDGSDEPDWQAQGYDDSATTRLTSGTIGVWSMGPGSSYWDDLKVEMLGPPPTQYTLTVNTAGLGSGTVTLAPPGGTYDEGTVVTLTANADSGSQFTGWSDDLTGDVNPTTITMNTNKTVTASFEPVPTYDLIVTTAGAGSGTVTLVPPGGTYSVDTVVTLTANADSGSDFTGWSDDLTGDVNPTTITMDSDKTVTATFEESVYAYDNDFESYGAGADPDDWLDTGANNSLTEQDLFQVFDLSGNKVFGTTSTLTNIHSHYVGAGSGAFSDYEYTGRMMIDHANGGIGVTYFSQYPSSEAYYRLRRYRGTAFHLSWHGSAITGDIDTGVVPVAGTWYRFRIQVEDTGTQTDIRAKVWVDGSDEPVDWQAQGYDDSATRLTSGTIGVWSMGPGSSYLDDLKVEMF